jgi:hypothetical protein
MKTIKKTSFVQRKLTNAEMWQSLFNYLLYPSLIYIFWNKYLCIILNQSTIPFIIIIIGFIIFNDLIVGSIKNIFRLPCYYDIITETTEIED